MILFKRFFIVINALICFFIYSIPVHATEPSCPEFPYFYPQSGAVAVVNCDFHKAYLNRVNQIIQTLGTQNGRPIILNLGGNLSFKYGGKTEHVVIQPETYHQVKGIAHIGFSVYLILAQNSGTELNTKTLQSLASLREHALQTKQALPNLHLPQEASTICLDIINQSLDFIDQLIARKSFSQHDIKQFYAHMTPKFLAAIKLASQIELNLLDQEVNRFLAKLNRKERAQLAIIVATAHQARAQEISLQYFEKKFGKKLGEGAINENGLVVMEGKFDEASALETLAKHYLDREASQVIFNDEERLQRDLLADATKRILKSHF